MAWRTPNFDFRWSRRAREMATSDISAVPFCSSVLQFCPQFRSSQLYSIASWYVLNLVCIGRIAGYGLLYHLQKENYAILLCIYRHFLYVRLCNRRWSQLIFIPGNKVAHTSTKVWRIRKYWKAKGIDLWDKRRANTISHTNLKIGQVDRQIYKFPHLYDAQKWSHSSS